MVDDSTDRDAESGSGGQPTAERPPPQTILEQDHVYDALNHPRRRYLCYSLLEGTEWTLTDLATKIAAWEDDCPEHTVTDQRRERVYVSLYHVHVPQLVATGVVVFDETTEVITPGENADQVLAALEGMGASLDNIQESHARGDMDDSER